MTASSDSYRDKKAFYQRVLTVYGRKPALEALSDTSLTCHALHLAHSNRDAGIVSELLAMAEQRGVEVKRHSRQELARISKNGKQDQGVALDIVCAAFQSLEDYLDGVGSSRPQRLLALDGITNPQNLGMIVRSAAAGAIDGIVWPRRGNAAPGPLVVKASAGTLYRAPVLNCIEIVPALQGCAHAGFEICILAADANQSLFDYRPAGHCVYVLGNETRGVSREVMELADRGLAIPMNNNIESLNVAVTASLIAVAGQLGEG